MKLGGIALAVMIRRRESGVEPLALETPGHSHPRACNETKQGHGGADSDDRATRRNSPR